MTELLETSLTLEKVTNTKCFLYISNQFAKGLTLKIV